MHLVLTRENGPPRRDREARKVRATVSRLIVRSQVDVYVELLREFRESPKDGVVVVLENFGEKPVLREADQPRSLLGCTSNQGFRIFEGSARVIPVNACLNGCDSDAAQNLPHIAWDSWYFWVADCKDITALCHSP